MPLPLGSDDLHSHKVLPRTSYRNVPRYLPNFTRRGGKTEALCQFTQGTSMHLKEYIQTDRDPEGTVDKDRKKKDEEVTIPPFSRFIKDHLPLRPDVPVTLDISPSAHSTQV
uniref:Uncharacterized protein n=1 Tax=Xenopus tropicalis TaxID=8364 RepID=A0A1B8Y843_XENTR